MNFYLLKYRDAIIYGFYPVDEEYYRLYKKSVSEIFAQGSYIFENTEYNDEDSFWANIRIEKITQNEYDVLTKLFGPVYSYFPWPGGD